MPLLITPFFLNFPSMYYVFSFHLCYEIPCWGNLHSFPWSRHVRFPQLLHNMLPCYIVCVYLQHFICPSEKLLPGFFFFFMASKVTLCTILLKKKNNKNKKKKERPWCHCSTNRNHIRKTNWSAGLVRSNCTSKFCVPYSGLNSWSR